ncbi:MAG: hypothetical protein HRU18_01265 [Pseudoalteromonas sp.]|uniref:hypothetical protein n=1 Tax=Pseudoalteromonas sp. TaxID=53249 RepID=UPI001D703955|nr:hypothetical protein [Pseudoalteromonas sp.]NRA76809.1 hypothetical protein [Pseudoalteromonas sp.]
MKRHIAGTNNRTLCGNTITDRTVLLDDKVPFWMSDCDRCLQRIAGHTDTMIDYMKILKAVSSDTNLLHRMIQMNNKQIKDRAKEKARWKKENLQ